MPTNLTRHEKNRKILVILGAILFVIAYIVAIILAIRASIYSARVIINVAPGDAQIIINGEEYKNGTVAFKPGSYHAEMKRDGFTASTMDFEVEKGEEYKLYACLVKEDGNDQWYNEHPEDYKLCNIANEYLNRVLQAEKLSDPIFQVTPYHSYDKGYNIDPYFDEDEKIIIKITALSCNAERRETLFESAIEYLEDANLNLDNYGMEKVSGC